MTVGEAGHGDEGRVCVYGIRLFDAISDREDEGVVSALPAVDGDAPGRADRESGALGESRIWAHTARLDHEIDGQHGAVTQRDRPAWRSCSARCGGVGQPSRRAHDGRTRSHVDPVGSQYVEYGRRHLGVEGRENVRAALHERHLHAAGNEILDGFEPDEAGSDHDGPWLVARLRENGGDRVDVVDRAEGVGGYCRCGGAGFRGGTPREDQGVVGLGTRAPALEVSHGDGLRATVDRDHVVAHPNIQLEPGSQRFRGLLQ